MLFSCAGLDEVSASSGMMTAVAYRSAIAKHLALLSLCSSHTASRSADLLGARKFLTPQILTVLKGIIASQPLADAWTILIAHLSDPALCHFVDKVMPEVGLHEISTTLHRCSGVATCHLEPNQHHQEEVAGGLIRDAATEVRQ